MKNRLVKISLAAALLAASAPVITSCGGISKVAGCVGKETLDVFNWGSYIDTDVLAAFEKEYNVCVNYSTFDSNETAVEKLKKNEVYDVIFPSDYAVEELMAADLIQPIDWSKVTTMSNSTDVNTDGTNELATGIKSMANALKHDSNSFDFLKYAVPYFWGTVGIVYDTTKVEASFLEANQWNSLKDGSYKIGYYDSPRDAFIAPLRTLGYSLNTTSEAEIKAATDWLIDQKDKVGKSNLSYVGDDVIEDMASANNRYDMALVYAGDATYQLMENEKLSFFKPTTGTNVWMDGMVIHKKSEKVDLAYKFISYMMRDENARANSLFVGYSSVKSSVYKDLLATDMADYKASYEVIYDEKVDEFFRYNDASKTLMNDAWAQVKLHSW